MKLFWIARGKYGTLHMFFNRRPICVNGKWKTSEDLGGRYVGELEPHLFPEVTFENSPQQVELRLLGKLEKTHQD